MGLWPISGFAPFTFGGRSRLFESGEIRLALLSLLGGGPKHGYQLMKEMRERSNGAYRASAGSVYPTLQQLEDEELIESEQQSGRRVYRLTKAGKKEFVEGSPGDPRYLGARRRVRELGVIGKPRDDGPLGFYDGPD